MTENSCEKTGWYIIIVLIFFFYFLGYGFCRYAKMVVHYTSFSAGMITLHQVEAGDAKLASPNPIIAAFFTPLRWLETRFWNLYQPPLP